MTTKPALVAALLALALLAGCADKDDSKTNEITVPDDDVSKQLGGNVVAEPPKTDNATLGIDTPILLSAATGPAGEVTGFTWRVPEGAIFDYRPFESDPDYVFEMIAFEVVPVVPEGVTIEEFAFFVVSLNGDEAYVSSSYVGVPESGTYSGALGNQDLSYEPELQSLYLTLGAGDLEAGDEIGFMLVGKSAQPASFGFLMSPLHERPDYDNDPAEDAAELLGNRSAVTLTPTGKGSGFHYGAYMNYNLVFATSVIHMEITSGQVTIADNQRTPTEPLATVRDTLISTRFDGSGYSEGSVYAYQSSLLTPNCVSVGTYDVQLDLHGSSVASRNLILEAPQASQTSLLTGSPIAFGVGEGDGASTTSLGLKYAAACGVDIITLNQLDLGAKISDLFGVAPQIGAASYSGIAGNLPPSRMWIQGDTLVLDQGGRLVQMAGVGAFLEGLPGFA